MRMLLFPFLCFTVSFGFINGIFMDIIPKNHLLYNGNKFNKNDIHELLYKYEKHLIFGKKLIGKNFTLTQVVEKRRYSRSTDDVFTIRIRLNSSQDREVRLKRSTSLIDDSFVFINRYENNSVQINGIGSTIPLDEEGFYRSNDAAVNYENGQMTGVIFANQSKYVIHPLPRRLGESLHIIFEVDKLMDKSFDHELFQDGHSINKRRAIYNRKQYVPDSLYIETAVFVDRDLFGHMTQNYPRNTEANLVRFVLTMINGVQLLYHHPSLGKNITFVLKRLEILHSDPRDLRRSSDIDVFLNNFCKWQRKYNPVSDSDPAHFDHAVILTGLDLYVVNKLGKVSNQVVGLAPVSGMCTSTSSCTINEGKHFESVFVVAHEIGHNLGMRHDSSETNCDPSLFIMSPTLGSGKITWSKCSREYLNNFLGTTQARCLFDIGTIKKRLDHLAEGLLPGERFDADQQCMLKYGRDSIRARTQLLSEICKDLHCQKERLTWTSHPALEGTTCGEDKWCRSGICVSKLTNSSMIEQIPLGVKSMKLRSPETSAFTADKKRFNLNLNDLKIREDNWSSWSDSTPCESGCLFGESGRLREGSSGLKIYSRKCLSQKSKCNGANRRFESCSNTNQCLNVTRTTVLEFAAQICSRAMTVDLDLNGIGNQKVGNDPEESCKVFCSTHLGELKTRGWIFPDGTVCKNRNSDLDDTLFCVNGRCEKFSCDESSVYQIDSSHCSYLKGEENNKITDLPIQAKYDAKKVLSLLKNMESETQNTIKEGTNINKNMSSHEAAHSWAARGLESLAYRLHPKCLFSCLINATGFMMLSDNHPYATDIKLCDNFEKCSTMRSVDDFATDVCTSFMIRVRGLSGKGMQISGNSIDLDRSCRVACQDEYIRHRFYLVNGEQGFFPIGTRCGPENSEMFCVLGRCLDINYMVKTTTNATQRSSSTPFSYDARYTTKIPLK